ncbi:hypothetical protein YTPLAS18_18080 [Nitrospira sp.]|nr:hypothetical protein YTPLAS18_18080 [Nitrospira sp.]
MNTAKATVPKLRISSDPMYQLLRDGAIKEFNSKKAAGQSCDLRYCDFRGLDLRGLDAAGLDFSDSYFRQTDLRGVDFREANLEGASINNARVSGAYFPAELTADEIQLSLQHGTRMRYTK